MIFRKRDFLGPSFKVQKWLSLEKPAAKERERAQLMFAKHEGGVFPMWKISFA